jgi:hypothetical protein
MGDVRLTPRQLAALFDALDGLAAGAQLVRQMLVEAMAARERPRHELRIIRRAEDARPRRKARPRA